MPDSDLLPLPGGGGGGGGGGLDSSQVKGYLLPDQQQHDDDPSNTLPTPSSTSNWENTGTAWYKPLTLLFYDYHVLGFNMFFVWRCPTSSVLLPFFRQNFTSNHLDVGVATGYFPSAALLKNQRASESCSLTLMDLNPHSLVAARSRILRDHPRSNVAVETVQHDALSLPAPAALRRQRFTSVSMFNLLHCIPAPCGEKTRAFELAAQCLRDGGVLAGCTVLPIEQAGVEWWRVPLAGMHLRNYNKGNKVFSNSGDRREVLEEGLRKWFDEVEVRVVGCVLLFRARGPKRARGEGGGGGSGG